MADNPNLITEEQYAEMMKSMEPVETPGPGASSPSMPFSRGYTAPYFSGSLPPQFQLDSNFSQARAISDRVPKNTLMPFAPNANPTTNAAIQSTAKIVVQSTPQTPDVDTSGGGVTDGITHGDPVWWYDSAFVYMRDDFNAFGGPTGSLASGNSATGIGELQWTQWGTFSTQFQLGGAFPHCGIYAVGTLSTSNGYGGLILNERSPLGSSSAIMPNKAMPLLENPGWKMTWVFRFGGNLGQNASNDASWNKKAFYLGLVSLFHALSPGSTPTCLGATPTSCRPNYFMGLRYDTSHTVQAWGPTVVGSGTGVYTLSSSNTLGNYNGGTNTYKGCTVVCKGFANAANNGTFLVTASTATTITTNNASSVFEVASNEATVYLTNVNCTQVTQNSPASGQATYTFVNYSAAAASAGLHGNGGQIGQSVVITGCTNAGNNGTFTVIGSTATTIIVSNGSAVTETPAANAAFLAYTDTSDLGGTFKFEVVQNPEYNASSGTGYRSAKGTNGGVFDTTITPAFGNWYRLEMSCAATGQVKMTLVDENNGTSASNTFTVPQVALTTGVINPDTDSNKLALVDTNPSNANTGVPTVPAHPWGTGSKISVSGFTSGAAGINGNWVVEQNLQVAGVTTGIMFYTNTAGASGLSQTATITGYAAWAPFMIWGDDTSGGGNAFPNQSHIEIDFFSFVWNPNLGPNAPGSPSASKSRYF